MICIDNDVLSKQNILEFFKCFHNRKKFPFCCGVPGLSRVEFSAVESNGSVVLRNDSSQLCFTSISMNSKGEINSLGVPSLKYGTLSL